MNYDDIEILFAEDSMEDATLTIRALNKSGFTNKLLHVKDGAEALDFMYCKGIYSERNPKSHPKLFLLDLKMPKMSGIQVLEKVKSDP
ncbi:Response regulator rcp1 [compost metagenome]